MLKARLTCNFSFFQNGIFRRRDDLWLGKFTSTLQWLKTYYFLLPLPLLFFCLALKIIATVYEPHHFSLLDSVKSSSSESSSLIFCSLCFSHRDKKKRLGEDHEKCTKDLEGRIKEFSSPCDSEKEIPQEKCRVHSTLITYYSEAGSACGKQQQVCFGGEWWKPFVVVPFPAA